MSVVNLVNLTEPLLNQNTAQGEDTQPTQRTANSQGTLVAQTAVQDLFTPSAQTGEGQGTAQEAGLFSVAQFSFFPAAAELLLGQNSATAPPSRLGPAATQKETGANVAPRRSGLPAPPSAAPQVAGATLNPPATRIATAPNRGSLQVQQELQALNQAFVALA